ncbi:MAG: hypothetical protein L0Y64_02675 [Myxococcaceae bacterium]|nr:hypothetical protein [Myxococcaceae bacterium]
MTPGRIVSLSTLDGCQQGFSFQVADSDLDDTLYVRWYVDFDPTPRPPPYRIDHESIIQPNLPPRNREEIRDTSATFEVRTDVPGSPIVVPGVHLVEAYVADAPLHEVEENGLRVIRPLGEITVPPDGGTPDQPFVVSYAWFVTTPQGCPVPGGGQ